MCRRFWVLLRWCADLPARIGHNWLRYGRPRAPMCSPFSAQAPNRGIMGRRPCAADPANPKDFMRANRMLVCRSTGFWVKSPGTPNKFGEARKKRFPKIEEFLIARSSGICDFSTNRVGGHSIWIFELVVDNYLSGFFFGLRHMNALRIE